MKRFLAVSLSALALAGCLEKSEKNEGLAKAVSAIEKTEINRNSPDMTVKSWWRVKDAGIALYLEGCKERLKVEAPLYSKLSELSTPEIYTDRACSDVPDTYEREITNVDVQSDTRAVVTARISNTTPPEPGAELSDKDRKSKEAGDAYQYVLERKDSASGWKIAQVSTMATWSREWRSIFKKPEPSSNRWVFEFQQ